MARNRKPRGDSRPADAEPPRRPGVASRRARSADRSIGSRVDDTSDPVGHAAPDAELAEAAMAGGEARAEQLEPQPEPVLGEAAEFPGLTAPASGPVPGEGGEVFGDERVGEDEGEERAVSARRPVHRNRVIAFAQGSWRELQRVQWPDQRQVVQATGVVIGFVIVAGAFLGVADFVATKIVHFLLS